MRHGRPEIDLESMKKNRVTAMQSGAIIDQYELSDLATDQSPPVDALDIARQCKIVFNSDLPRSISSVRLLGVSTDAITNAQFRESALPWLSWSWPKLGLFTWCILFRIAWLFGFSKNGEDIGNAKTRALACAGILQKQANSGQPVLLLGHGIMNRLIAKQLKKSGWKQIETNGERYWSFTIFER